MLLVATVVAGAAGSAWARSPGVTTVEADDEAQFLSRINRVRVERGLSPLRRDDSLRSIARFHSAEMAIAGFVGLTSPKEGSIVDRAASAAQVALVDVTAQIAVGSDLTEAGKPLLDPSLTRVGVGIVSSQGRLFLTQVAVADEAPRGYTAVDAQVSATFEGIRSLIERICLAPVRLRIAWL
jgi:uncharacterized protein YkwD